MCSHYQRHRSSTVIILLRTSYELLWLRASSTIDLASLNTTCPLSFRQTLLDALYLETSETLFAEVLDKFRYPGSRVTGHVDDLHNHSGQLYAQLALAHLKNPNLGLALDIFRRAEKGHGILAYCHPRPLGKHSGRSILAGVTAYHLPTKNSHEDAAFARERAATNLLDPVLAN